MHPIDLYLTTESTEDTEKISQSYTPQQIDSCAVSQSHAGRTSARPITALNPWADVRDGGEG